MEKEKSSYSQILKSTSLFGGVQVINIIISIVRSKLVAILLGPSGMGIVGLLTSTSGLVSTLTSFSLSRSAVKNIASVNIENDPNQTSKTVTVLRKLVLITGFLGVFGMFFFAKPLSEMTFGNQDFTTAFKWISLTLLFNQISQSQLALLRGMSKLKSMAKCTLLGSLVGLFISIPIYYIHGHDGIVPAIIISAVAALVISFFYSNKLNIQNTHLSKSEFLSISKEMLGIGTVLTLSSAAVLGSSYIINVFIRAEGNLNDVGYYTAGFTIVNTYFGLIFVSLTTDYYPKLAAIAKDNNKAIKLMNEQSEMTLLIIAPVLVMFLIFSDLIITILYTKEFLTIGNMILWAALGIYLKAASWALGVIFISKGDAKYTLFTELFSNIILTILSLLAYQHYGLEGLGISFFISFILMYFLTYGIVKWKYNFQYSAQFYIIFFLHFFIGLLTFFIARFSPLFLKYVLGIILIIFSSGYSVYKLNQVLSIKSIIKNISKKLR